MGMGAVYEMLLANIKLAAEMSLKNRHEDTLRSRRKIFFRCDFFILIIPVMAKIRAIKSHQLLADSASWKLN
jgi:hypothetical protein